MHRKMAELNGWNDHNQPVRGPWGISDIHEALPDMKLTS
jgi:hypothetical protein